jgi:OFA family oxalate/formate antiporter-like MFS transporter
VVGVVALSGLATSVGTLPVLSVFLKPMTEEFGWNRTVFTGATSLGTVSAAALAPLIGPQLDRFGARWILTASFLILGTTVVFVGAVSSLWHLYLLMVIGRSVNLGVISVATMGTIVPKWFVAKRGRAVALGGMGHRVGLTIHPLIVQAIIGLASWRAAAITMGLLIWAIAVLPVALFLRRRPEDLGLLPDGETPESRGARSGGPITQGAGRGRTEISFRLSETLHQRSFYLLTFAFSLSTLAFAGSSFHSVAYLTDRMLSAQTAVVVIAVWAASAVGGMLIAGFLVERVGARRTLIVTLGFAALSYALMLAIHSTTVAIIWGVYCGLTNGGLIVIQQTIFADYFGRESLGAIRGAFAIAQSSFNATGTLIAAIAYDTLGSYSLVFTAFGVISVLSAILVVFAKPPIHPSARTGPSSSPAIP